MATKNQNPEQEARDQIDQMLVDAGWIVQDYKEINPGAGLGIALREVPLKSGPCDYLLMVDRANLGRQAKGEFDQFVMPETGRKFTEEYNVQHLTSNQLDTVSRVTICTIQRLYSMLRGEELDEEFDEKSGFELAQADNRPKEVAYNPAVPIETFDFIVTDECHRSIYGLWRQVLEYFDAFLIGLTATPSKQTIGFFNQNLVMEYNHERAVADGVNVGYEVYRIKTKVTEQGG